MGPGRLWRCRRTMSGTTSLRESLGCRFRWWLCRRKKEQTPRPRRKNTEGAETPGLADQGWVVLTLQAGAPVPQLFTEYGISVNSGAYSGLKSEEAIERMAADAEKGGFGKKETIYRLRDWGISRQRYWGTPIPVIYCEK